MSYRYTREDFEQIAAGLSLSVDQIEWTLTCEVADEYVADFAPGELVQRLNAFPRRRAGVIDPEQYLAATFPT